MLRVQQGDMRQVLFANRRARLARGVPQVQQLPGGARLRGDLLYQEEQNLLQSGLLQVPIASFCCCYSLIHKTSVKN